MAMFSVLQELGLKSVKDIPDLYQFFEIKTVATTQEIQEAFRRLVLTAHPDKGGTNLDMGKVKTYRKILLDSNLRRFYDLHYNVSAKKSEKENFRSGFDASSARRSSSMRRDSAPPPSTSHFASTFGTAGTSSSSTGFSGSSSSFFASGPEKAATSSSTTSNTNSNNSSKSTSTPVSQPTDDRKALLERLAELEKRQARARKAADPDPPKPTPIPTPNPPPPASDNKNNNSNNNNKGATFEDEFQRVMGRKFGASPSEKSEESETRETRSHTIDSSTFDRPRRPYSVSGSSIPQQSPIQNPRASPPPPSASDPAKSETRETAPPPPAAAAPEQQKTTPPPTVSSESTAHRPRSTPLHTPPTGPEKVSVELPLVQMELLLQQLTDTNLREKILEIARQQDKQLFQEQLSWQKATQRARAAESKVFELSCKLREMELANVALREQIDKSNL